MLEVVLRIPTDFRRQHQERKKAAVLIILPVESPTSNTIMIHNLNHTINSQQRKPNISRHRQGPTVEMQESITHPTTIYRRVINALHLHQQPLRHCLQWDKIVVTISEIITVLRQQPQTQCGQ